MTSKNIREMVKRAKANSKARHQRFQEALKHITRVAYGDNEPYQEKVTLGGTCGDLVKVRPCAKEFDDKTYIGILIGSIPLMLNSSIKKGTKTLNIERCGYNPMIYIPSMKKVVFGAGSWWGNIDKESDLKDISDKDIDSVWYVKAIKTITK